MRFLTLIKPILLGAATLTLVSGVAYNQYANYVDIKQKVATLTEESKKNPRGIPVSETESAVPPTPLDPQPIPSNTPSTTSPIAPQAPLTSALSEASIRNIILGYLSSSEIQASFRGVAGPQGEQGIQGPAGTSGTSPAPIFYYPPNPQSGSSGGSLFSATDLSSTRFITNTATVSDTLTTQALSVLGNSTLAGTLNVTGNTTLAGNLTVSGTITGSVVGSVNPGFTQGSVVFQGATGLAQDNSNFFWDDTNNRVGIGTTSPAYALDVLSAGGEARLVRSINTNGGDVGRILLGGYNSSNASFNYGMIATNIVSNTAGAESGALRFYTANAGSGANAVANPAMTILNNGNVGIGTAGPVGKLDIRDGGSAAAIILSNTGIAHGITDLTETTNFAQIGRAHGTRMGLFERGISVDGLQPGLNLYGVIGVTDPTDATAAILLNGSKKNTTSDQALGALETVLQLQNYTTNLVTVLGSGNMGIGVTTPAAKLEVNSGIIGALPASSGSTQSTGIISRIKNSSNAVLDIGGDGNTGYYWLQATNKSDLSTNYPLLLNPNGGSVGIGTTAPQRLLHLSSASNTLIALSDTAAGADAKAKFVDSSAGSLRLGKFNDAFSTITPQLTILNDGKVTIGTYSAPMTGLLNLNASTGVSANIQFAINSGATKGYIGQAYTAGTLSSSAATDDIVVRAQNNLIFASGGDTARIYAKSDGNVGIGIVDPQFKAEVGGGSLNVYNASILGTEMTSSDYRNHPTCCGYDTFTASGSSITSAITDGSALALAHDRAWGSGINYINTGSRYILTGTLTLNSGIAPVVLITDSPGNNAQTTSVRLTAGAFSVTLIGTAEISNGQLIFQNSAGEAGNWSISNISLKEVAGGNVTARGLFTGGGTKGLKITPRGTVAIGAPPQAVIDYADDANLLIARTSGIRFGNNSDVAALTAITVDSSNRLNLGGGTGNTVPAVDNTFTIGASDKRWSAVWSVNGTIQTSDRRMKTEITDSSLGLEFIKSLRPVSYRWTESTDMETHYGLIAQELQTVLGEKSFGGLIYDTESDLYSLNYSELISPMMAAIQELDVKIGSINQSGGSTTQSNLSVTDTLDVNVRLTVHGEAVFKGNLYVNGKLFITNKNFAGSVLTDVEGKAVITFDEAMPTQPIVNLTPVNAGGQFIIAVVDAFNKDSAGNIIGFVLRAGKLEAGNVAAVSGLRINYFVAIAGAGAHQLDQSLATPASETPPVETAPTTVPEPTTDTGTSDSTPPTEPATTTDATADPSTPST